MGYISVPVMQAFLSSSISSLNANKLNGILAEIDLRNYLFGLNFAHRVSAGGWIARCEGAGRFGHETVVFFPDNIVPNQDYPDDGTLPSPQLGLHTICSTFHQIGIRSYFCTPQIPVNDRSSSICWFAIQLGLPAQQQYQPFPSSLTGFQQRQRAYNFQRYHTNVGSIPPGAIPEQFAKEHLRIKFQELFLSEISDVDGILWGNQFTYPLEIKEKTPGFDRRLGEYFGLDLGPFVKLAFYASKHGNLHSIFIVREIDNTENRNLIQWWFITFERLAQFASWNPQGGGQSMMGTQSTVVKVPKAEFSPLDLAHLNNL